MTIENNLRVWWIPQVPMHPFHVDVPDVASALMIMDALGRYDAFQFENNIKPDYCNAGGLEVFERGEWVEWENEDGHCVSDLRREMRMAA